MGHRQEPLESSAKISEPPVHYSVFLCSVIIPSPFSTRFTLPSTINIIPEILQYVGVVSVFAPYYTFPQAKFQYHTLVCIILPPTLVNLLHCSLNYHTNAATIIEPHYHAQPSSLTRQLGSSKPISCSACALHLHFSPTIIPESKYFNHYSGFLKFFSEPT